MATIITTPEGLFEIRNNLTGEYELGANIDLDGTVWASGSGWLPIVNFTGVLDGKGYAIRNLYINRPDTTEQGLFGTIGTGCNIQNLSLLNVNINGRQSVGGLVGRITGGSSPSPLIIKNIMVRGVVKASFGTSYVGGVIGEIAPSSNTEKGLVEDCGFEGVIEGEARDIGGFIGNANSTKFNRCYSYANIKNIGTTAPSDIGGFIGQDGSSASVKTRNEVTNCFARGEMFISNLSSFGNVAGFCGYGTGYYLSYQKCYSAMEFTNSKFIRGFISVATSGATACLYDSELSGVSDTVGGSIPKTTEQMKTKSTYESLGFIFD
jgi:hypothetical protein